MRLDELIAGLPVVSRAGGGAVDVSGVVCNSRHVRPGGVFVAVPGADQDGWAYAEDAVQRGAVAVVSEATGPLPKGVAHVVVRDARLALGQLSAAFHGHPSDRLSVVGITGTNGKTTTAYLVQALMDAGGFPSGLIGTVEYRVGARVIPAGRTTPDAPTLQGLMAQMAAAGCRGVVMEVSSHSLDQQRVQGVDFDVAVFTNLTRDHLDYHGTMDAYFEAKMRLFQSLGTGKKADPAAVVNIDDPWGRRLRETRELRARSVTFGIAGAADVCAEDLEVGAGGSTFRLRSPWGSVAVTSRLLGRHNVYNALAAAAATGALGLSMDHVVALLQRGLTVAGRLEEIPTGRGFRVFVDYAHTDDALENVLRTLREITRGRLLVVFGCGGNRDRTKRPLMGRVATERADLAIVTSDNPRREKPSAIIDDIRSGFAAGANAEVIEDRAEAIRRAIETARDGDMVLIAGKGHEHFQEFEGRTIPFDDRQVARGFL